MRNIHAPVLPPTKGPKREDWLESTTLTDSQGREHDVQSLLERCRQNYASVCLKKTKDGRLGYRKRSPEEIRKLAEMSVEEVQFRLGLKREQAALLRYRCLTKVKLGVF